MVDNQHQKITGYRDLSQAEIDVMNEIKRLESNALKFLSSIEKGLTNAGEYDKRWLAIARTDLQKGFMAFVRAIARPAEE